MESFKESDPNKELLHLLALGEMEISIGEGYDLEDVLAEADAILAEESGLQTNSSGR